MQQQQPLKAAMWMIGSILSFTAMAIAGRAVAGVHDTFEIMLWRSIIGIVLVSGGATLLGRLHEVQTRRLPLHLARNLAHFAGQNLWFWALTVIPLAQVVALEFTSPLWVVLLSPLVLGERLTVLRAVVAALGFAGALIVARPDFTTLSPGVMAAAAAAVGFAGSIILTKTLTRNETVVSILFWLTVMQAGLGLAAAGWDGDIALPTVATLPWLMVIGAAGVIAHMCLTMALSLASATVVVPVDFARLPIIALVGMALYHEPLDIWVLVGGLIILGANLVNIRMASRAPLPDRNVTNT